MLADLRGRAEAGDSDLPWGHCVDRSWDEAGALVVTREFVPSSRPGAPGLLIRELPFSAHPQSGVGGTGGVVWPGAVALVDFLRGPRGLELLGASCCRVVEIGAGCGLAGLTAAALLEDEASSVLLTDCSAPVLENLRHIVEANASVLRPRVEVAHLAWEELLDGTAGALSEDYAGGVDLLLGSDVIWGGRGPLVARVALHLVRPGGRLAVCSEVGREGLDAFEALLRGQGPPPDDRPAVAPARPRFDVETVPMRVDGRSEDFVVYVGRRCE